MANLHITLPLMPFTQNPLLKFYWLPLRLTWKLQYAWINTVTLGLLDDLAEEVENALVEGADVVKILIEKIEQLQQTPLTEPQRQLIARTSLDDAEIEIKNILKTLITNVLQLPFTRTEAQPSRKRFPVTLEGVVVDR